MHEKCRRVFWGCDSGPKSNAPRNIRSTLLVCQMTRASLPVSVNASYNSAMRCAQLKALGSRKITPNLLSVLRPGCVRFERLMGSVLPPWKSVENPNSYLSLACCLINVTELYMGMRPKRREGDRAVPAQAGVLPCLAYRRRLSINCQEDFPGSGTPRTSSH